MAEKQVIKAPRHLSPSAILPYLPTYLLSPLPALPLSPLYQVAYEQQQQRDEAELLQRQRFRLDAEAKAAERHRESRRIADAAQLDADAKFSQAEAAATAFHSREEDAAIPAQRCFLARTARDEARQILRVAISALRAAGSYGAVRGFVRLPSNQ